MATPRASIGLAGLLTLLAVVALLGHEAAEARLSEDGRVRARGRFWEGLDSGGWSLQVAAVAGSLPLQDGESLRLIEVEQPGEVVFDQLSIRWEAAGGHPRFVLRDDESAAWTLDVDGSRALLRARHGHRDGELLARVGGPAPSAPDADTAVQHHAVLRFDGSRVELTVDDETLLTSEALERVTGRSSVMAAGGALRLLEVELSGRRRDASGALAPFTRHEDFSGLAARSTAGGTGRTLLLGAAAALALGLLLRALCLGRPPPVRLWIALGVALLPADLCGLAGFVVDRPISAPLAAALLALGLPPGLLQLRPWLRETAPPEAPGRWERLRPALVCAAVVTWASVASVQYRDQFWSVVEQEEAVACARPAQRSVARPGVHHLDAGSALAVPRVFRDLDLSCTATLLPDAILQVRLRAPDPDNAEGVSFLLSTRSDYPGGFFLESRVSWERLEDDAFIATPGRPLALQLSARGRSFEARVDGRVVARASTPLFPEGGAVLLTMAGEATVDELRVDVVAHEASAADPTASRATAAALPWLALALLALLGRALLGLPAARAAEMSAFALLPAAIALSALSPRGLADGSSITASLAATALLVLLVPLVHARRPRALPLLVFLLVAAGGTLGLHAALDARAWPSDKELISNLPVEGWEGERVPPDLLHAVHPRVRRWNRYLTRHELRDRAHSPSKPPGTVRVLCVGTSSTFGGAVDVPYPFRLEALLLDDGLPVEVLNGGVPGATGPRLYWFLRNVLLGFEPDVMTLSLTYNDSFMQGVFDERAYFAEIARSDHRRSWWDDLNARRAVAEGRDDNGRRRARWVASESDEEAAAPAAARFEATLRDFARLCRAHGVELILVKEPLAGDLETWLKAPFRAAIDRVGEELDVPVVDPTPALQQAGGAELFRDDVHPVDEGHQVVAEALHPALRRAVEERLAERER